MLKWIILLTLLIVYNIATNIYAIKFYTYEDDNYIAELKESPILLRIPHVLWYWLEALYRLKLLKPLSLVLLYGIISFGLTYLVRVLATTSWGALCILLTVLILSTAFVLLIFVLYVSELIKDLIKKKKRTSDKSVITRKS
jgi:hypothetical protein